MDKFYEEMMDDLEEYYEAAGFSDFYKRCLEGSTPEDIIQLHQETFGVEEQKLEGVEQKPKSEE
jgi:hypothetical protein